MRARAWFARGGGVDEIVKGAFDWQRTVFVAVPFGTATVGGAGVRFDEEER